MIRTTLIESIREAAAEMVKLEDAEIIVSGGRGLGKAENFSYIRDRQMRWAVPWVPPVQLWTPAGFPMSTKWDRQARPSLPSSTSPAASLVPSSTRLA